MTGRLYRPETQREQVLQEKLNQLFDEHEKAHPSPFSTAMNFSMKIPQPTRWSRAVAFVKRLVGH